MNIHHNIIIAGAGGIARAAGLILAEWSPVTQTIFIGNRTLSKAQKVARWIEKGSSKKSTVNAFHLPEKEITDEMKVILNLGDVLLDCLPGSLAPKMAQLAKDFNLPYANLTEYVAETDKIILLAKNAQKGFLLQTGLAPGYINVLAHKLFIDFCNDFNVEIVDTLQFRVGALTDHAVAPHYYGFTWSPVGVATEYLNDAVVLRDFKKIYLPSLSERATIVINGTSFEEDLTSGGAADLPDALSGKVCCLDYKTLRYPGHYSWLENEIKHFTRTENIIADLQSKMEAVIPHIEDDQIILYAAVEGKDNDGVLHRREVSKKILPQKIGKHTLRAIQTTTAVSLLQSAQLLLETSTKGVILQSQIQCDSFLKGHYIKRVYGEV